MAIEETVNNMIEWAVGKLGNAEYAGWCLSFIETRLKRETISKYSAVTV